MRPPAIAAALLATALPFLSCSPEGTASRRTPPAEPAYRPDPKVTAAFDFTWNDLETRLSGLPDGAGASASFWHLAVDMTDGSDWHLKLVDKRNGLGRDFVPPEMVPLSDYPAVRTSRDGLELHREAAESLARLCAAASADGVTLIVSSAYRSFDYQEGLFDRYAARDGEEAASRYSARPGHSQHQLGTTVDFGEISNAFATGDAGIWMADRGPSHGWSLSYPQQSEKRTGYRWESWHWRWIGPSAAEMQEVWFGGSQQALLEFWEANGSALREARVRQEP